MTTQAATKKRAAAKKKVAPKRATSSRKATPKPNITKPSDLFTRSAANEGIKFPLFTPYGEDTGHWLMVRGVDSDAYKSANDTGVRRMSQFKGTEEAKIALYEDIKLDILASLVCGWSFDTEFTLDAVRELLVEAPAVAHGVDQVASQRALFFKKPSMS